MEVAIFVIGENNRCINTYRLGTNAIPRRRFCPCTKDLARMLISADDEGAYAEEKKEYTGRRTRR
jgi:hypothetical protein